MSSLTGNLISSTYQSILKIGTNNTASANLVPITDGFGNTTAASISTTGFSVSGAVAISGSLTVYDGGGYESEGATYTQILSDNVTITDNAGTIGNYSDMHGIELYSGSNSLDITVSGNSFGDYYPGTLIATRDNNENPAVIVSFQNHDNWTDGTVTILRPLAVTGSLKVSQAVTASGLQVAGPIQAQVTGSISVSGSLNFTDANSMFVFPILPAPIPVLGSAYTDGTALFIYDGSQYRTINFS